MTGGGELGSALHASDKDDKQKGLLAQAATSFERPELDASDKARSHSVEILSVLL
jgi:hypothetical protein